MLTEEELKIRRVIWSELSDFYLDTELSDDSLKQKAIIFKNSGLNINEIKEINYYEVAPQLLGNLRSTVGVWDGFNQEGLHNILEIMTRSPREIPHNIFQKIDDFIARKTIDFYTARYFKRIDSYF